MCVNVNRIPQYNKVRVVTTVERFTIFVLLMVKFFASDAIF